MYFLPKSLHPLFNPVSRLPPLGRLRGRGRVLARRGINEHAVVRSDVCNGFRWQAETWTSVLIRGADVIHRVFRLQY